MEHAKVVSTKMPKKRRQEIEAMAAERGISVSRVVSEILEKELTRQRKRLAPESIYVDIFKDLERHKLTGPGGTFGASEIFEWFNDRGQLLLQTSTDDVIACVQQLISDRKAAKIVKEIKAKEK